MRSIAPKTNSSLLLGETCELRGALLLGEDFRAELLARNPSCLLDRQAMFCGHRSAAMYPLPNEGGSHANGLRKCGLTACDVDSFLNGGSLHDAATLAKLAVCVNSAACGK
jgi:hypothetical protein